MAAALLLNAVAAASTLFATSSALRRNLMKKIREIDKRIRNTASTALTMIKSTWAAVSIKSQYNRLLTGVATENITKY
jgi:hypothetical protein